MANKSPAIAAIEYALNTGNDGMTFLRCWLQGEFPEIRAEWPDAPEEVFIGADPLHPETRMDSEVLESLLNEVAAERARQDAKWGGAEHDDQHSTAIFVQLIQDYAGWSRVMAGMNSPDKARRRLIQVAALALAGVESIDRKAATN